MGQLSAAALAVVVGAQVGLGAPPVVAHGFPNEQLEVLALDGRAVRGGLGPPGGRRFRRRLAAAAPGADAQAVRFTVDGRALAHDDTRCVRAGDVYVRGVADESSPWCEGFQSNCRGVCTEDDVHGAEERAALVELVRRSVAETPWLALPADTPPTTFARSRGRHEWYYRWWGMDAQERCLKDCHALHGFDAPEYCDADGGGLANGSQILLIVTAPHTIAGVAASGGACAYASDGRPTAIVVNWAMPLRALLEESMDELVARYRPLVLHEVFHGLGWVESQLRHAHLIEPRAMTDVDGATETVWAFRPSTATTVMAVAAAHYNCSEPVVALMQWPELGRGSHLPERIARQSLMSYGDAKHVDALSLAPLADLGHFVVRLDRAECTTPSYGAQQGCAFLTSRCGIMRRDRSVAVGGAAECAGSAHWQATRDAYLAQQCAFGDDPCAGGAGYDAATQRCDAQCVSEGATCSAASSNLTARRYHGGDDDDDDDGLLAGADAWLVLQVLLLVLLAWGLGMALFASADVADYPRFAR